MVWLAPGGSVWVNSTTRSATSGANGGMRDGRVLSRSRPSAPASMNRCCQRHTAVLALAVRRMIPVRIPQTRVRYAHAESRNGRFRQILSTNCWI